MPYKIDIVEKSIILIVYTGEIFLEDYHHATIEAVEMARSRNIHSILSNHVNTVTDISVADVFSLPGFFDNVKFDRSLRIALLVDENDKRFKDYHFFEITAQNRGYNFKVFITENEAREWLKS